MGLTSSQQQALQQLLAWGKDSTQGRAILEGPPGVGKTFLLANWCQALAIPPSKICFATFTHKAAGIVRQRLAQGDVKSDVRTIHSLLGLREKLDPTTGETVFEKDPRQPSYIGAYKLIVADEASQIPSSLKVMLEAAHKLLYVGDQAQLPPVGEFYSPVFYDPSITTRIGLTEIVRYGGAIGEYGLDLRNHLDRPTVPKLSSQSSDLSVLSCHPHNWLQTALDWFASADYRHNPDYCRLLAHTNRRVDELNGIVHAHLYGQDAPEFVVGERLVTRSPCKIMQDSFPITIPTSFEMTILDCQLIEGSGLSVWKVDALLDEGIEVQLNVLSERSRLLFEQSLNQMKQDILQHDPANRKHYWQQYYQYREWFHPVSLNYATTVYKSQGSTYQYVGVDQDNITGAVNYRIHTEPHNTSHLIRLRNHLLLTACTRAAKGLLVSDSRHLVVERPQAHSVALTPLSAVSPSTASTSLTASTPVDSLPSTPSIGFTAQSAQSILSPQLLADWKQACVARISYLMGQHDRHSQPVAQATQSLLHVLAIEAGQISPTPEDARKATVASHLIRNVQPVQPAQSDHVSSPQPSGSAQHSRSAQPKLNPPPQPTQDLQLDLLGEPTPISPQIIWKKQPHFNRSRRSGDGR